jgi:hypothetical protein
VAALVKAQASEAGLPRVLLDRLRLCAQHIGAQPVQEHHCGPCC